MVAGLAAKVINHILVDAPNQVQLQVKIAEVSRSSLKRVGINWQNIGNIALFGNPASVVGGFAVRRHQQKVDQDRWQTLIENKRIGRFCQNLAAD